LALREPAETARPPAQRCVREALAHVMHAAESRPRRDETMPRRPDTVRGRAELEGGEREVLHRTHLRLETHANTSLHGGDGSCRLELPL
jgi:hypothetical protein